MTATADGGLDMELLREVADRQEITELISKYGLGVHERDPEMIVSCFSDDAVLDYGRKIEGIDAVRAYFTEAMTATARPQVKLDETIVSTPVMTNVLIDLDGDVGTCTSTCLAIHAGMVGDQGRVLVNGTRNLDDLVRTPGGWRISRRTHVTVWTFDVEGTPKVGGGH